MRVLGFLKFYSSYIKNLHVDSKPFFDLIRDDTPFEWTPEHEALFNAIKERISKDTILAILNKKYPFHIHVDSSRVGTGSILVQQVPEEKNCFLQFKELQKEITKNFDTLRELCVIVLPLQTSSLDHHIQY